MKKTTRVKPGSMVKLIEGLRPDTLHQTSFWEEDLYFLRDPDTFKITNTWVTFGEISIVVSQDPEGLLIMTPRGHTGWIGKEKMEVVR